MTACGQPDQQTLQAYANMDITAERGWGCISEEFLKWIRDRPSGSSLLDVGCGNGTALVECLRHGLNAMGVDASPELVRIAGNRLAEAGHSRERVMEGVLPGPLPFEEQSFEAISCCAVLMHLPEIQLFDALHEFHRLLKVGGSLFLSIPKRRPDVDPETHRDAKGRLFTPLQSHQLSLLCERMGFRLESVAEEKDSLGREGIHWTNLIFTRLDAAVDCPLNRIEKILNHDRKDATYKLALVRALADIAQTEFHVADFLSNGKVAIPLGKIADRWLWYYWPLFAHDRFIAQKNGEREDGGQNLAIRKVIYKLIDQTGPGGLTAFHADWRRGRMDRALQQAWRLAHSKLKSTIWNMPVRFAGDGEEFSVFQYNHDQRNPAIEMDAGLWREFCLTGSWIQDATLLRWAELTETLSQKEVKASEALDCLLTRWDPERDVHDARGYYLKQQHDLSCVWSGKKVGRRGFEVDHALPYALWKNNDLWNLLPVLSSLNNQKRDSIPSAPLLQARKDLIIHHWQGLNQEFGDRFLREAQTLMGRQEVRAENWEGPLFSRLSEACEITATQRGVKRWQPNDFTETAQAPSVPLPKGAPYATSTTPPLYVTENQDPEESHGHPVLAYEEVQDRIWKDCLPLVGGLAAGSTFHGFEVEGLDDPTQLDWISVPERLCGKNRFVVCVAGDSMEPALAQGSLAVFEYHRRASEGRKIVIANIPIFGTSGDGFGVEAIKYLSQTETHWVFESANPEYEPILVPKTDCPMHPILGEFIAGL